MNAKKKFYFTIGFILVGLLIWVYLVYIPYIDFANNAQKELNNYSVKIESASKAKNNLLDIEKQLKLISEELSQLESKLIKKSDLKNIVQVLSQRMSKYNVNVVNVTPIMSYYFKASNQNSGENYINRLPLEMRLEARFLDFGRFIEDLDRLPFFVQPNGFTISENKTPVQVLSINFKASIYVSSENIL